MATSGIYSPTAGCSNFCHLCYKMLLIESEIKSIFEMDRPASEAVTLKTNYVVDGILKLHTNIMTDLF